MKKRARLVLILFLISVGALAFRLWRMNVVGGSLPDTSPLFFSRLVSYLQSLDWLGPISDTLGISSFIASAIVAMVNAVDLRGRRQPPNPFIVIRRSADILPTLYLESTVDASSKTLNVSQIPYYERQATGNLYRRVYEELLTTPHLLLVGESGVGKTREMAEVARLLIAEGYTVVLLRQQGEPFLQRFDEWPDEWPRKDLVFLIDDLHLLFRQKVALPTASAEPLLSRLIPSPRVSFEQRFQEFIQFVAERVPDYKLIATVTTNSAEWRQMNYPSGLAWTDLNAGLIEIPRLDQADVVRFVSMLDRQRLIDVESDQISPMAAVERNGSPRNILRNFQHASELRQRLTSDTYIPTLQGSIEQILHQAQRVHPVMGHVLTVISFITNLKLPVYQGFVMRMVSYLFKRDRARSSHSSLQSAIDYLVSRQLIQRDDNELLIISDDLTQHMRYPEVPLGVLQSAFARTAPYSFPLEYLNDSSLSTLSLFLIFDRSSLWEILRSYWAMIVFGLRLAKWVRRERRKLEIDDSERHTFLRKLWRRILHFIRALQSLQTLVFIELFMPFVSYKKGIRYMLESHEESAPFLNTVINKNLANRFPVRWAISADHLKLQAAILRADYSLCLGHFALAENSLLSAPTIDDPVFRRKQLQLIGYACAFQGKWGLAHDAFQQSEAFIAKEAPGDIPTVTGMAWTLAHLGRMEESRIALSEVVQRQKKRWDPFDVTALAAAHVLHGDTNAALELLANHTGEAHNLTKLVEAVPELSPVSKAMVETYGRYDFLPGVEIYRLNSSLARRALPVLSMILCLVFVSSEALLPGARFSLEELSSVLLLTQLFMLSYRRLIREWTYRLITLPNEIHQTARHQKDVVFTVGQIALLEEYSRPLRSLRIYDSKGSELLRIPPYLDGYEEVREYFARFQPIQQLSPNLWSRLSIWFYAASLLAFLSPTWGILIFLVGFQAFGVLVNLITLPKNPRARRDQLYGMLPIILGASVLLWMLL